MIDFHSHVLPGLDDGSKDIAMSLKMLNMSYKQGVSLLLATPHFYVEELDVPTALFGRSASSRDLKNAVHRNHVDSPDLLLGFEVHVHPDLRKLRDVEKLCIEGTRVMLLEMPYSGWNDKIFSVLRWLEEEKGIIPLMAHIERYIDRVPAPLFEKLMDLDYFYQVNAASFINRKTALVLDEMLVQKQIHVLGSDAHNMLTRCSLMDKAYRHIETTLGRTYIDLLDSNGTEILSYKTK